jgi:hypothetical protein
MVSIVLQIRSFGVKYRSKWDKGLPLNEVREFYHPETHYWEKIQDEKTNPPRQVTPSNNTNNNSASLIKIQLSNKNAYKKTKTNQTDLSNTSTTDFKLHK